MPLYEYSCKCGESFERFYPMSSFPRKVKCKCGRKAVKVCAAGGYQDSLGRSGGIWCDHPAWLDSAVDMVQDPQEVRAGKEERIEGRTKLRQFMKENRLGFKDEMPKTAPRGVRPISEAAKQKAIESVRKVRHQERNLGSI